MSCNIRGGTLDSTSREQAEKGLSVKSKVRISKSHIIDGRIDTSVRQTLYSSSIIATNTLTFLLYVAQPIPV